MRVVVIGEHGQLASCLRERAGLSWCFLGRQTIDLAHLADFERIIERHEPDVLINAAAYTAVDKAETDRDAAFAINEAAPAVFAGWCARQNIPLLHISTDYVFDGRGDREWREDDEPHPLSIYGASKLAGERAVQQSGARALVLRTAWVHSPYGHNFVKTMIRLASAHEQVSVVADQRGAPTSAQDLADGIVALLPLLRDGRVDGLYHCTAGGSTNWADFAEAIFEAALEDGHIKRVPVLRRITSAEYPTAASRPLNSVLSSQRLLQHCGIGLPGWRLGLLRTLKGMEKTS